MCLVSLFVSVCRSCVSSSSVSRPPIPRWCPVRAWLFFTFLPTYLPLVRPRGRRRLLEAEQACSSLTRSPLLSVVCCALVCSLGTWECWGGRQGECGPELCVRQLRVCGSQLAVCLVSLLVSVCRSCVSSSSVSRPPIPRWCPVRAWLFFTFLPNLT